MKKIIPFIILIILSFSFNGCSKTKNEPNITKTTQVDSELDEFSDEMAIEPIYDPLEKYNRIMTSFNDTFMIYILIPVSNGYKVIVHKKIRESIGNFFNNLGYPIRVTNNLLQGKIVNSIEESQRFLINSTLGMAGLFDVAKEQMNINPHQEDFGQTLGYWGVESGFHIVLPFLGPSNIRDALSIYPDSWVSPLEYYDDRDYNLYANFNDSLGGKAFSTINEASFKGELYLQIKKDAIDLYPYLRDSYEQYREKQIKE